jgi:O-antigen/teichoic acid export membrane protein
LNTSKQSLKVNTYYSLADKALGFISSLLLIPFIIKCLGVETYGIWVLITSIVNYFLLAQFGVSQSFDKYIAEYAATDWNMLKKMTATSFYLLLGTALVLVAATFIVSPLIPHWTANRNFENYTTLITVFMIAQSCSLMSQIFMAIPRGLQRFNIYCLISIAGKISYIASLIVLLNTKWGIASLVAATILQQLVTSALSFSYAVKVLGFSFLSPRNWSWGICKKLYSFGVKVQVTFLASWVVQNFDKILIARMVGLKAVAVYDVGSKIVFALREIPYQLAAALVPRASEINSSHNNQGIVNLYMRSSRYTIAYALGTITFFLPFALQVLTVWIGKSVDPVSAYVLQVVLVGSAIQISVVGAHSMMLGIGRPGIESVANLIAVIVNIVLSIGLYYGFGFKGIVWGTCCAFLTSALFIYLRTNSLLKIRNTHFVKQVALVPLAINVCIIPVSWLLAQWSSHAVLHGTSRLFTAALLGVCAVVVGLLSLLMYLVTRYFSVNEMIGLLPFNSRITGILHGLRKKGSPKN